MPITRRCRITLENFLEGRRLPSITADTFKIEGKFHPREDIHSPQREGTLVHLELKGFPEWGMTTTTKRPPMEESGQIGYFHKHSDERVYLRPIKVEENDGQRRLLIPCYECEVALEDDWGKYGSNSQL